MEAKLDKLIHECNSKLDFTREYASMLEQINAELAEALLLSEAHNKALSEEIRRLKEAS